MSNAPSLMLVEEMLLNVAEFQNAFGLTVGDSPEIRDAVLAGKLLMEEATETRDALIAGDMVKVVDGVMDTMFVAAGILVRCGVFRAGVFWDAVHRANMRKVGGEIVDGKLRKPAGWVGPEDDITAELKEQGWNNE